jgi:hypothetical protein
MFFAPAELTDQRRDEMVEKAAQALVRRGMAAPAALVLEMHRPVSVIGANLVLLGTPLAAPFLTWKFCDDLALFLMDRANIERLARRIEQLAGERKAGAKPSEPPAPSPETRGSEGTAR